MKILVLGAQGQLGRCLRDSATSTGFDIILTSRREIDVCEFSETAEKIAFLKPDVVINAAAFTAVDGAEEDPEIADLINHRAVDNIARACHKSGSLLIHLSTNYVFDGSSSMPYREHHEPNALGVYAQSKLMGEKAIEAVKCHYMIIRTAWIYSEYGNNFLKTMLRLASRKEAISIVCDQFGCPTYGKDLASAIWASVPVMSFDQSLSGIYHFCGDTRCSWFQFAQNIFSRACAYGCVVPEAIYPIRAINYSTRAIRPANGALDCEKFETTFDRLPSDLSAGLDSAIKVLCKSGSNHDPS